MSEVAIEESRGPSTKTHVCSKCNSRKPVFKASDGVWERWECPKCGHVDYVKINKRNANTLYQGVRYTRGTGPAAGILENLAESAGVSLTCVEEAPQQEVPSSLRNVFYDDPVVSAMPSSGNFRTPEVNTVPTEPSRAAHSRDAPGRDAPGWGASAFSSACSADTSSPVEILRRWVNGAVQ